MIPDQFFVNLVAMYPITGENIILIKNDHCTPSLLFLPIFSEIASASTYQAIKIMIIRYSFIGNCLWNQG